jgi:GMP synthase (glutamine-hydrolysing)
MIVKNGDDPLMAKLSPSSQVWMSHGDTITTIPEGYSIIASTEDVPVAAYRIEGEQTWGIQFHPEVYHSEEGFTMIENFVKGIWGAPLLTKILAL